MNGIYVLIVNVERTIRLQIGASGMLTFQAGLYAYVGSAQTNLELGSKASKNREALVQVHRLSA